MDMYYVMRLCPTKVVCHRAVHFLDNVPLIGVGWLVDEETIAVDHLGEYEVMGEFGWADGWRCEYHAVSY